MPSKNHIRGLSTVISNLNRELKKIEGGTLKGLIRGGLRVLRDVELKSPKTPLDLANLRASRFMVTSNSRISMGRSPSFKKGSKNFPPSRLSSDHKNTIDDAKGLATVSKRPTVVLGFSARYAAIVHEMTGDINWSRAGSGPKFFEKALDRNADNILKDIQKEAKIK